MTKENDTEKLEKEVVAKLEEYRSWSDNLTKDEIQSLDERKPSKRKSYTETSPVPIKKKKVGPTQPKNAVQTLNEYKAGQYRNDGMKNDILIIDSHYPGLEYAVVGQSGPSHAPSFEMAVTLNGVEYRGVGG